ncbi:MAG TPA: AAA family ATPase [Methanocorpusculum sp.]|nr:AAA family ATPase [Methanocorpusculum sp.]HJJ39625.1 AAA family ATPase [Methanocorpusculum sp.]HJJ49234.1 AAA family ATPase [Methanocorpusculum sp.]HJJ56722.1 AAA family ATPase [Methanocorpusculum sp.]HJJ95290.1 AAA family ATPase [Methanocorpusculum sp.]
MNVIGIVGYPASGKGEFSKIAASNGVPVVVMGDIIREKTTEKGQELTDENIGNTAKELREKLGMDAVAILTAERVKVLDAPVVLIDGIRGDAEVKYFRSVFKKFTLIGIKAAFSTRLSRLKIRGRTDDGATEEFLHQRDAREDTFGLARALELADIELQNETERRMYEISIRRTLEKLA